MSDQQTELFQAETQWFHVFKAMIDSGELAKMDGSTVKVYLVVKAHTNFATGRAFPAIETIAEKSGMSTRQVIRCIESLAEMGYITKEKKGRTNLYTLREKIQIEDEQGRPTAVATWDYLPSSVQRAVADLKNVMVTGDLAGAKIVHIERLQINVNNLYDNAVNFNVQEFYESLEKLPSHLRDKLKAGFEASQRRKAKD
jgi:DNA-binding transcriptional MocR family regulator